MSNSHFIIGVHITHRLEEAIAVQKVLTAHGKQIKTRLGLHEIESDSPAGVLILEMVGDESGVNEMRAKLDAIEGIETQQMVFAH
jgi:hypothetical protein